MGGGGQQKRGDWRDIAVGAALQCIEAATLGMPFEVWKTRQGANPHESAVQSFKEVLKTGGPAAFWRGAGAKQLESASKGAVLLYSKEYLLDVCEGFGMNRKGGAASAIGGAGGGVAQTIVMAPLTLVITAKVKNKAAHGKSTYQILSELGVRKMYGSAVPVALRQASNWALRQALAAEVTRQYAKLKGSKPNAGEQVMCGLIGGMLACVNQPFEVLRIMLQARHSHGEHHANTRNTAELIYKQYGLRGFYTGLIPRMGLSAWQTLFMVTFADMIKEAMNAAPLPK